MGPGNRTQIIRLGGKPLYLLSHLVSPIFLFYLGGHGKWTLPGHHSHRLSNYFLFTFQRPGRETAATL